MKEVSADFITFFISACFTLGGIINYIVAENIWHPLWIIAFTSLVATIGIDVIERLHIERRVKELTDDEKLPGMCRRQAD